jgi:16S rRNA (cytidine1402-2'-O)-methyltransferase
MTGKLLAPHGIKATLRRYDAHASDRVHDSVLADLAAGKQIALCSDAGTPGISDPGVLLVSSARAAGYAIETIPGPSALTAALSLAGVPGNQFTFLGFAPQKKGRQTFFATLPEVVQPAVFFESTHRIMKALESLLVHEGATITIARELTKLHEEVVVGSPAQVQEYFQSTPIKQKGEFVIIFRAH